MTDLSHSRFWASIESFRCACPACQAIIVAQTPIASRNERTKAHRYAYDRRTQTLRCPWCGRRHVAGLLLWPLPPSQKGAAAKRKTPPDVRLTPKELAQFRNLYAGGWWMEEPAWNGDPVNRALPEECSCPPLPWSASCPVHGGERLINTEGEDQ
jgi:hypothetical protein